MNFGVTWAPVVIRLPIVPLALAASLSIQLLVIAPVHAQAPPVSARAWVDKGQVRPGDLVRVFIAIDNRGQTAVANVHFVDFQSPAFRRSGCWVAATPSCHAEGERYGALPAIPAGDTLVIYGELTRRNDELADGGEVLLTGTFEWTTVPPPAQPPTNPVTFTGVTSTTPITLAAARWFNSPFALSIRELSKDLVLPLVLLLGGYVFQRFQHSRTERQAIWTQMLGKVTRDTEQHFLPFATAVATFTDHAADVQREEKNRERRWADKKQLVVYDLLVLDTQMTRLTDAVGGIYLALRPAETVIQQCWHAFLKRQHTGLGADEALTRTIARMKETSMPFGTFTARLTPPRGLVAQYNDPHAEFRRDVATLTVAAERWIVGNAEHFREHEMNYLLVLLSVLDAEVDRPFERWYGKRPYVNRPALQAWQRRWQAENADPTEHQIARAIAAYRRETGVFWQAGLSRPWRALLMLKQWMEDRHAGG